MAESEKEHPSTEILRDFLSEESRKNRRALLSAASVCLAVRFTEALPKQIPALGITFSTAHEQRLIGTALILQGYLCVAFVLSALADYVRWRRDLRRKTITFADQNGTYSASDAVRGAQDMLQKVHFRLEAPEHRLKTELESYAQKNESVLHLARLIWKSYPSMFLYFVLLFLFPIALFLFSFVTLLLWLPSVRA